MQIDDVGEDAAWLKAIDWHFARGYKPMLAVFRGDDGEMEILSILGEYEQEFIAMLATNEAELWPPEMEQ